MNWSDINTVVTIVHQNGRNFTRRIPRPFDAMPRWFKRFVKTLNHQFNLQGNLKLQRTRRRVYAKRKAVTA